MTYRIVTEQELSVRKGEIILSFDEMIDVVSIKESIFKFIDKSILELKLSLWNWAYRWKEESAYAKIDWFLELKQSLEKTEENMRAYKRKNQDK